MENAEQHPPRAGSSGRASAPVTGLRWPCVMNLPALREEGWGLGGRFRASLTASREVWRRHRSLLVSFLLWTGLGWSLFGVAAVALGAAATREGLLVALGVQGLWGILWPAIISLHLGAVRGSDGVRRPSFGLPNGLTLLRILLIPAVCWAILAHQRFLAHGALVTSLIFVVGFSDVLDGLIARIQGSQTVLGRYLDHLADVLICSAIALAEFWAGLMPIWLTGLYLVRYLGAWVGGTYGLATHPDLRITPSLVGRLGTLVAGSTLLLTIAQPLVAPSLVRHMSTLHLLTGGVILGNMLALVVMALRGTAFEATRRP